MMLLLDNRYISQYVVRMIWFWYDVSNLIYTYLKCTIYVYIYTQISIDIFAFRPPGVSSFFRSSLGFLILFGLILSGCYCLGWTHSMQLGGAERFLWPCTAGKMSFWWRPRSAIDNSVLRTTITRNTVDGWLKRKNLSDVSFLMPSRAEYQSMHGMGCYLL